MPSHSQLVGALARDRRFHRVSARLLSDLVDLTVLGAIDPDAALEIPAAPCVVRPLSPDDELPTHVLDFADPERIAWMMRASYTFRRTAFSDTELPAEIPDGAGNAVQWVLVTGEGLPEDALLGAAARIAAGICTGFDETVAVIWEDGGLRRGRILRHGRPGGLPPAAGGWQPLDAAAARPDRLVAAMSLGPAPTHAAGPLAGHVLVVSSTVDWPGDLPRPHRVVVLTERRPETIEAPTAPPGAREPWSGGPLPDALAKACLDVLRPDAVLEVRRLDGDDVEHRRTVRVPLFSSVVVCHLLPERPAPLSRFKPRRFLLHLRRDETEPPAGAAASSDRPDVWADEDHTRVPDRTNVYDTRRRLDPRVRWRRDRCAVGGEAARLHALVASGKALRGRGPEVRPDPSWERVGRAITHRQVGVALSGGGAYAFAFLQVLDRFTDADTRIPVDVLASASGGSILAAYLAHHHGRLGEALDEDLKENAGWLGSAVWASVATLRVLRAALDADMPSGRIEQSELRFTPATLFSPAVNTAIRSRRGPYEAHVVLRGTPGEAVRRSGSLPPLFAATPHARGGRFLDGMLGGMVPCSALLGAGADFLISCFLLPGPRPAHPETILDRESPRPPILGRLGDALYGIAFGVAAASEEGAGAAHAYVVPPDSRFPFVDAVRFGRACSQVGAGRPGGDIGRHWDESVERVHTRWRAFLGR